MEAWHEDLEQLFAGTRAPHKLFGDIYYANRISLQGQLGVNYHLQHLSGIGKLKEVLWPPQRCPGWFIDDDGEWQPLAL
ncbi:hypothetical protein ABVK25_004907 [Lepraria finkii]|uniref:Uncharacterized protein n=1 Tax=Lepraria finkii TaxID=1340010 RepID=A0ABR4BCR4_9LECA